MRSRAEAPWNDPTASPSTRLDADAFAALYEEHRAALFRYCLAKTGDRDRTEDIVQDVFAKAFAGRDRFDPSRDFWPWLASIAARECIDSHRRRSYAESRTAALRRSTRSALCDPTSTTVLSAIDQRRLTGELARLPMRQRIVLQLVALDDWSYAEVAERLGYSLPTVKALLARARQKLRDVAAGSLGVVHGLRRRWQRAASRTHVALPMLPSSSDLVGALCGRTSVHLAIVASVLSVALGAAGDRSTATDSAVPDVASAAHTVSSPTAVPGDNGSARPRARTSGAPAGPAAMSVTGDVERAANEVAAVALPPDDDDDPNSMRVSSFTLSPRYEDDHTIFLVRDLGVDAPVLTAPLLVSRDGGASWQRLRGLGLAPVLQFLFPPSYPRDPRLFVLTTKGLQVSRNGGDTFETLLVVPSTTVSPLLPNLTAAAISPRFDDDQSILVVAGAELWKYRADTGTVDVVALGPEFAGHQVRSVAFAADDPSAGTVLLGTLLTAHGFHTGRCTAQRVLGAVADEVGPLLLSCQSERVLVPSARLPFRVPSSSRSNVVFLALDHPQVSLDGGRTFRPARGSQFEEGYMLNDLTTVPSPTGESAIVAQGSWPTGDIMLYGPQLARTDDAGRTWRPITIDLPKFPAATRVVVTPTGRIVAGSLAGGLACSEDDGRTWARLCPTPERV